MKWTTKRNITPPSGNRPYSTGQQADFSHSHYCSRRVSNILCVRWCYMIILEDVIQAALPKIWATVHSSP